MQSQLITVTNTVCIHAPIHGHKSTLPLSVSFTLEPKNTIHTQSYKITRELNYAIKQWQGLKRENKNPVKYVCMARSATKSIHVVLDNRSALTFWGKRILLYTPIQTNTQTMQTPSVLRFESYRVHTAVMGRHSSEWQTQSLANCSNEVYHLQW